MNNKCSNEALHSTDAREDAESQVEGDHDNLEQWGYRNTDEYWWYATEEWEQLDKQTRMVAYHQETYARC